MIRFATTEDAYAVQKIYSHYVLHSAATFEITPPTESDFKQRIFTIQTQYPFIVYEQNDQILGYAYASAYREREAYQRSVSSSIYLSPDCLSRGIGSALYTELLQMLTWQGYRTCLAGITLPNEKSCSIHKKFGFTEVGICHQVGYKLGAWHDVIWLEKMLSDSYEAPQPLKHVTDYLLSQ